MLKEDVLIVSIQLLLLLLFLAKKMNPFDLGDPETRDPLWRSTKDICFCCYFLFSSRICEQSIVISIIL